MVRGGWDLQYTGNSSTGIKNSGSARRQSFKWMACRLVSSRFGLSKRNSAWIQVFPCGAENSWC